MMSGRAHYEPFAWWLTREQIGRCLREQYRVSKRLPPKLLALASKLDSAAASSQGRGTKTKPKRALWIELQIEPALLLENGRKPRIVAPVRFHDHRIVWLLLAQEFIDEVLLPAGVPVGPQLRSLLSDRGAQQ